VRALILDSRDARASLAAARGLARGGWTVGVAAPSPTLASASRHVRHRHRVPLPEDGEDAFVDALGAAIAAQGYEVVFASSDADMLALAAARERIAARVPYPGLDALRRAMDKLELGQAARLAGLASPAAATSATGARELAAAGPVIVKERLHGPVHVNPFVSDDANQVARRVEEVEALGAEPLVQPVVRGVLMAFTSIVESGGHTLARVQQVAERTWPHGLGCSVRAHTVAVDEELGGRVAALLRELGWHGLSELQFLVPDGGEPQLIDFNGRFYGSMSLAIGAGVNLPDLWARSVTARPVPEASDARPGVRYQWLEGDLRAAREDSRGTLRDLVDGLRYAAGAKHSVSSLSDPAPLLRVVRRLAAERRGS
jgi:predicted ATP-grasp superfamily ATP-dependent carboligase